MSAPSSTLPWQHQLSCVANPAITTDQQPVQDCSEKVLPRSRMVAVHLATYVILPLLSGPGLRGAGSRSAASQPYATCRFPPAVSPRQANPPAQSGKPIAGALDGSGSDPQHAPLRSRSHRPTARHHRGASQDSRSAAHPLGLLPVTWLHSGHLGTVTSSCLDWMAPAIVAVGNHSVVTYRISDYSCEGASRSYCFFLSFISAGFLPPAFKIFRFRSPTCQAGLRS